MEWYLIQEGSVIRQFAFAEIIMHRNAIVGILENEWFACDYVANEDTTLIVIPCKNAQDLRKILSEHENFRPIFLRTAVEQRHQALCLYASLQKKCMLLHNAAETLYSEYKNLCSEKLLDEQDFPRMEQFAALKIHSVAGNIDSNTSLISQRPFRSPHHTISDVALVGGGTFPQPGEISLAHNGVLFLDELPEFKRTVLEVMRQPLEDRKICISRAKFAIEYPASFMLVASMNPCPCGYYNHPERQCMCAPGVVQKYLSRISGPLLDRIDIHIEIVPVPFEKLSEMRDAEPSETVRERVIKARQVQEERFKDIEGVYCNAQMSSKQMRTFAQIDKDSSELLKNAMQRLNLSARAYDRIIKVARTIADLDDSISIRSQHIAEAINYRNLDREGWAG
jgi:Mg chelatase-like protein